MFKASIQNGDPHSWRKGTGTETLEAIIAIIRASDPENRSDDSDEATARDLRAFDDIVQVLLDAGVDLSQTNT